MPCFLWPGQAFALPRQAGSGLSNSRQYIRRIGMLIVTKIFTITAIVGNEFVFLS